ncbi:YicC/YloC family endoribonuclease [Pikeienuella sp. HZG-20]|uniref:YicC/YloC family endoribonuclease n=1 Tax=Paludibacillus litoralis TaxID=3133267 RepID=UPI0030ED93FE
MQSMTGFAVSESHVAGRRWRWEAKSVNGRGLDLRFRLAEGTEALEPQLRAAAAKRFSRGNIGFTLRADGGDETGAPALNEAALAAVIDAARAGEAQASASGLDLAPTTIGQILALRGVMAPGGAGLDDAALSALGEGFAELLRDLETSRAAEGARAGELFTGFIDRIEDLTKEAEAAYAASRTTAPARLAEKVAALMGAGADIAPERLQQELALLAVKADVREELDRLSGHVAAARALIGQTGPIGRKLDFLTQEFNREANTLCSKATSAELTSIGLELKVVIDQMREQAQNVE